MATGIAISQKCIDAYSELNKRECACLVLKISRDTSSVDLERTVTSFGADLEAGWKKFVEDLPTAEARYLVTDFPWKETPTVTKSKVVMITWTPEETPVRQRMISASSLEHVTSKVPVQKVIQTTDPSEISYACLKAQIAK